MQWGMNAPCRAQPHAPFPVQSKCARCMLPLFWARWLLHLDFCIAFWYVQMQYFVLKTYRLFIRCSCQVLSIWSALHIEKFAVREGHIIIRLFIPEMNQFHIAVYNDLRTV